jgi:hypothetical protein
VATSRSWLAFIPVNPSSFCHFCLMCPRAWPTKVELVITGFQWLSGQRGCTGGRPHTDAHRTGWDSLPALGGALMFCSHSWPFSLLPSCLPVMPPDAVQATGNLGYYWGPVGVLLRGTGPERMLGCLGCPQGHGLLTTLELPTLYGVALQYLLNRVRRSCRQSAQVGL